MAWGAIIKAIAMVAGLIMTGALGYMTIENYPFLDAVYMTVISLTTVGYGETIPLSQAGRVFTIFLLLFGVGLILMTITQMAEALVEGNIRRVLGRRSMDHKIDKMKDHFIICGYGRMGRVIDQMLTERGISTVIIEKSHETTAKVDEEHGCYVLGSATEDEVLIRAGIERARGLVSVVDSDADNVYVCLSARGMNPKLQIITRAADPAAMDKLKRAGANTVVPPTQIGGRLMANIILRPAVVDFFDPTLSRSDSVRMEEVLVGPKARLAGKSLMESGIRSDLNIIQMKFNPGPKDQIMPGATLVVIGRSEMLAELARRLDAAGSLDTIG